MLTALVLTSVGFFIYKTIIPMISKKTAVPVQSNLSAEQLKKQEFEAALKTASASDRDLDGIPDIDEAKYQTSITSADTDSDGLLDLQEVSIFKTNPIKADTDGDGFSDGYEVRRGLDPFVKQK